MNLDKLRTAARQAAAEDPATHIVDFDINGWSLRHPLTCRGDMLQCAHHRAASEWFNEPMTGRWSMTLDSAGLPELTRVADDYITAHDRFLTLVTPHAVLALIARAE